MRRVQTRLYIGNLPFSVTEEELRELFGRHGAVQSVNVVTDRETGRPRGFAFVQFEDAGGAEAAMRALDGSNLGGRTIRVNEAVDRGRGGPGGGGGGMGGRGGRGGGGGGGGGYRDRGPRDRDRDRY
jgi:RNA recognition motif-containing protein